MPFAIDPQPGEVICLLKEFRGSHSHVFAMAVSNQALYLPAQNRMTFKKDSWYFKRVPLSEVREVQLRKQRSVPLVLFSMVMLIFGTVLSFLMMRNALFPMAGSYIRVSGWPFAIAVGGIVIPFIGRARKVLVVMTQGGKYKWKPQLAVDKKTRNTCSEIQTEILRACAGVGIRTADSK